MEKVQNLKENCFYIRFAFFTLNLNFKTRLFLSLIHFHSSREEEALVYGPFDGTFADSNYPLENCRLLFPSRIVEEANGRRFKFLACWTGQSQYTPENESSNRPDIETKHWPVLDCQRIIIMIKHSFVTKAFF